MCIAMSIAMSIAFRSPISPPTGFCYKKPCVVKDVVKAPTLCMLAAAAYRFKKCGRVIKKKTTLFPTFPTEVVYELFPPKRKRERWFCRFIENIDDKTFLGRWYIANSTTVLDKQHPQAEVFEWRTVMKIVL